MTHEHRLTARNDGGMRTVIYTGAGPGMVTDEIAPLGGFTTAPTPLESVIGALCGSIGVTFAKASRDIGLGYSGIDFEASFALDARSPAGQSETAGRFDAVGLHALVHDAQPSAWLDDVGRTAVRRCPVTRLLADAGVAVEMTWSDVPPEPLARQVPQARRWLPASLIAERLPPALIPDHWLASLGSRDNGVSASSRMNRGMEASGASTVT